MMSSYQHHHRSRYHQKILYQTLLLLCVIGRSINLGSCYGFSRLLWPNRRYRFGVQTCVDAFIPSNRCIPSQLGESKLQGDSIDPVWLPVDDIKNISAKMMLSPLEFEEWHADVVAFTTDPVDEAVELSAIDLSGYVCSNKWFRLRPNASTRLIDLDTSMKTLYPPDIEVAERAAQATLRWCNNFVSNLGLCPWAKASLATRNAIRIKVVPCLLGLNVFEDIVRSAALELLRVTGVTGSALDSMQGVQRKATVDPNVAITFIVAVPPQNPEGSIFPEERMSITPRVFPYDFEFEQFNMFVTDLEDRLFDEADEKNNCMSQERSDFIPIGDLVTIAPFHPDWSFAPASDFDMGANDTNESPINFEKRTPYPTVSLVRTSAITAAGAESTDRIAAQNEETLMHIGSHVLEEMFREQVIGGNI